MKQKSILLCLVLALALTYAPVPPAAVAAMAIGGAAAQGLLVHDAGRHRHALAGQHRFGDAARRHQWGGQAAGEVSAAPVVRKAFRLYTGGIIGMSGPGHRPQGVIIL